MSESAAQLLYAPVLVVCTWQFWADSAKFYSLAGEFFSF